jgi:hypothetical protein
LQIADKIKSMIKNCSADKVVLALGSSGFNCGETGLAVAHSFNNTDNIQLASLLDNTNVYETSEIVSFLINDVKATPLEIAEFLIQDSQYSRPLNMANFLKSNLNVDANSMTQIFLKLYANSHYDTRGWLLDIKSAFNLDSNSALDLLDGLQIAPTEIIEIYNQFLGGDAYKHFHDKKYSAVDLADFFKNKEKYGHDQATFYLFNAKYSLTEICMAVKSVYNIDAITQKEDFENHGHEFKNAGASDDDIEAAIKSVYGLNDSTIVIRVKNMKKNGSSIDEILKYLQNQLALTTFVDDNLILTYVTNNLLQAGYSDSEVEFAILRQHNYYRSYYKTIANALDQFYEKGQSGIADLLKGASISTPEAAVSKMKTQNYSLYEITLTLMSYFKLNDSQAASVLAQSHYFAFDEIAGEIYNVYKKDCLVSAMSEMKKEGKSINDIYSFNISLLADSQQAATIFYSIGYGISDIISSEFSKQLNVYGGHFDILMQPRLNVYNQKKAIIDGILQSSNITDIEGTVNKLKALNYDLYDIIQTLKNNFSLTYSQAKNLLDKVGDYNKTEEIGLLDIVYKSDATVYYINYYRKAEPNNFKEPSQIYDGLVYNAGVPSNDTDKLVSYMTALGYTKDYVLKAFDTAGFELKDIIEISKKYYGISDYKAALDLLHNKLNLRVANDITNVINTVRSCFADVKTADLILTLRDDGYAVIDKKNYGIFNWIYDNVRNDSSVDSILGFAHTNDLKLSVDDLMSYLVKDNYSIDTATDLLIKDKYTEDDIMNALYSNWFTIDWRGGYNGVRRIQILKSRGRSYEFLLEHELTLDTDSAPYTNFYFAGDRDITGMIKIAMNHGLKIGDIPEFILNLEADTPLGKAYSLEDIASIEYDIAKSLNSSVTVGEIINSFYRSGNKNEVKDAIKYTVDRYMRENGYDVPEEIAVMSIMKECENWSASDAADYLADEMGAEKLIEKVTITWIPIPFTEEILNKIGVIGDLPTWEGAWGYLYASGYGSADSVKGLLNNCWWKALIANDAGKTVYDINGLISSVDKILDKTTKFQQVKNILSILSKVRSFGYKINSIAVNIH